MTDMEKAELQARLDAAREDYDQMIKRHRQEFYNDGFLFVYAAAISACFYNLGSMWFVLAGVLVTLSVLSFWRSATWR